VKSLFEKIAWWLFVIWAAVGTLSFFLNWYENPPVDWAMITDFMKWGDFIFIVLAGVNAFICLNRHLGFSKTIKTVGIIGVASLIIEGIGVQTGYPFGDYIYHVTFGPKIFNSVPLAIPFAWIVVVCMSFFVVIKFFPQWNKIKTAFVAALLVTAIDYVLEPFAYSVRVYWTWSLGEPPIQNYISWFVCAFLFCLITPMYLKEKTDAFKKDYYPIIILSLILTVFIVGYYV
jgi:putative membrane protein